MTNTEPHSISDDDLIQRAVQGDKEAFGMLYERYLAPIYRYCYFRVGSPLEAEDLTEATFLKAWESLPRSDVQSFRAWLYRIAHNLVVDHHRSRRPDAPVERIGVGADTQPLPESAVQAREDSQRLVTAISALDPIHQQVIVCRFVNQLSHGETSQVLGLNENHVRILQFRALKKLAALLRKDRG